MEGIGKVKELKGEYAILIADPQNSCSSCSLSNICNSNASYEKDVIENIFSKTNKIIVLNPIGAKPNEIVKFEYDEKVVNRGIFIVFGIPILFAISGLILGFLFEKVFKINLFSLENFVIVLSTVVMLLLGTIVVKIIDKKEKCIFSITEILVKINESNQKLQ